jgi:uncharacterized protein (TIGR02246 family)
MRTLVTALVLFSSSVVVAAPKASEEDAVKARVADFIAVFNKGDAKAASGFFADDATLVNPVGIKATGPAEIEKVIAKDISTILHDAKMEMKVVQFRSIDKGAAWVELEHTVTGVKTPDGKMMNLTFHVPALLVKKGKNWMIAEARPYAYLPPPPPPPAAGAAPAKK